MCLDVHRFSRIAITFSNVMLIEDVFPSVVIDPVTSVKITKKDELLGLRCCDEFAIF